jgi:hypothetical protein
VPNESKVRIKAAKVVSDVVTPLSSPELGAFNAYVNKILPVGTFVSVTSAAADDLKVYADVYFDPLVIAADGSLLTDAAVFPVEDAINEYITNLPFNGDFNLNALINAVQLMDGVVDIVLTSVSARYGALAYSTITHNYVPDAGYLNIASGFDLSSTLTYIADV